jgi:hypothetical protein
LSPRGISFSCNSTAFLVATPVPALFQAPRAYTDWQLLQKSKSAHDVWAKCPRFVSRGMP